MATPISILIAALGGEGGGVLTEWLAQAVARADYPVQTTSIPGVAQRTGATTYYVEVFPETHAALAGRRPVMGLYPSPGAVDLLVASELVEAGRAVENGYVSPDRTTLIAATHRIYSVAEKSAMADGRFDMDRILRAAKEMPANALLLDTAGDERLRTLPLNAVMLGAIAASGVVPVPQENFRHAIRDSAIAVERNLAGFEYGLELAAGVPRPESEPAPVADRPVASADAARTFPADCRRTVELGIERCRDYQDAAYADLYVQRMQTIVELEADRAEARPHPLCDEVARQLALWMTYEDIVRVADLKTRPDRFAAIREEAKAEADTPLRVRDYFKPGPDELAALLPPMLGRRVARWAERRRAQGRWHAGSWHVPMHLHSSGILGFTLMWSLARMRRLRRRGFRFAEEQAAIEQWLEMIRAAAPRSPAFAMELARLPGLLKGYSDTHRRGLANYRAIIDKLVRPWLADAACDLDAAAPPLARVRAAALADPDGQAFVTALEEASCGRYDAPAQQLTDA
ncbi:MAG: indolepyruvate oxidoreductase subunit beta family protein [Hyphomicrobiales bacterium]